MLYHRLFWIFTFDPKSQFGNTYEGRTIIRKCIRVKTDNWVSINPVVCPPHSLPLPPLHPPPPPHTHTHLHPVPHPRERFIYPSLLIYVLLMNIPRLYFCCSHSSFVRSLYIFDLCLTGCCFVLLFPETEPWEDCPP